LIGELTNAVVSVYGEWVRSAVDVRLIGIPAGRWARGGATVATAAPSVTFGMREEVFAREDAARVIARLISAYTEAVTAVFRDDGGTAALVSKGAGGDGCKLTDEQVAELEALLDAGPAGYGWDEDQCWTLARIAALIGERFGVCYTLAGVACLLHRRGFSVQVPTRRAA